MKKNKIPLVGLFIPSFLFLFSSVRMSMTILDSLIQIGMFMSLVSLACAIIIYDKD